MSNERRAWSWRQRLLKSDLPSTTRHVMLTLSCHVNDAGEPCFPAIKQLVEETGLSKQSVLTHLEIGKEKGWIAVRRHGYSGQKWARNEYELAWPDEEKAVKEVDHLLQNNEKGGQRGGPKVVKEVDLGMGHHIYGFSHVLPINPNACDHAGVLPFDRFWQAWPSSAHKKYKADCRRKWDRMKLDREIDIVLAHVANVIATSDAALRDGGQYLTGVRSYLANAEWREPVAAPTAGARVGEGRCKVCDAVAKYKIGGAWLCQTHFYERDDD